jgi:hypothetical protein
MIRAFFWWVIWLVIFTVSLFLLMAGLYDLLAVPLLTSEIWETAICIAIGLFLIIYNFIRLRRRRRRRRKREKTKAEILQELITQKAVLRKNF